MIRPLILGGMVYGPAFLDIFERFCVASMRAPENLEALRSNGASVVLATDKESCDRLTAILGDIPHELYELPAGSKDTLFETLAGMQATIVRHAADKGCAFHMLMPDQCYSERYFPNLFRLAEQGDVVHNGLNVALSGAVRLFRRREADGALSVSANVLGDVAWEHLHERMSAYLMNRAKVPVSMPPSHFHLWRAQDRVMLFSPYNSPVYLTPETARRYPPPPLHTLDREIQRIVDEFVCPTLADDMVMIGIEQADVEAQPFVDWETFAASCWGDIGGEFNRLPYYAKPIAEVPAAVLEGMPTAADVMQRQGVIAAGLEEWGIVGAAA
ncbi:MAG: hypothetical protein K0R61_4 [Microvirga sp.]|nr:hypothetical protein [Microvirga sp.]MDF2969554.1 hypothetical protein [Microvirga sp.]